MNLVGFDPQHKMYYIVVVLEHTLPMWCLLAELYAWLNLNCSIRRTICMFMDLLCQFESFE